MSPDFLKELGSVDIRCVVCNYVVINCDGKQLTIHEPCTIGPDWQVICHECQSSFEYDEIERELDDDWEEEA